MPPLLRIRPATPADKPAMLKARHNALRNSNFHKRCFPASDPTFQRQYVNWIDKNMADPTSHVISPTKPPLRPRSPGGHAASGVRRPALAPAPAPGINDAQPVEQYVSPLDIFLPCHAYRANQ